MTGHATDATAPLFTSGVTSSGVEVLTPEKTSMTADQVPLSEPVQV